MNDIIKIVLGLSLIILLIVIGPILTIWALNTLFPVVAIPYTIETWFAVVILGAFLKSKVSVSK